MLFREFYNSVLHTSISSNDDLPFTIKNIHFKKGELITRYEQVEDVVYFINTGIVEMSIKSYMTEKIIDFFFENEMFCGFTSFLTQLPTDVQILALMDCEMEMIPRDSLMDAYVTSLEANKFGRILTRAGLYSKIEPGKRPFDQNRRGTICGNVSITFPIYFIYSGK